MTPLTGPAARGAAPQAARPARPPVTALTFDFWNTLYTDHGDGMSKVRPARMEALRRILAGGGAHPREDALQECYRAGYDAYMAAWTAGRHFGAREQVLHFLTYFGVDPASLGEDAIAQTTCTIEEASLQAELKLLSGVLETVPALAAAGYRLGIISDTSLTPGRILKRLMEKDGLLGCFTTLTFSDETGFPKPDRRMFLRTLEGLGAEPVQAAHIGDTPRTDIAGAKAMGMVAIRCAGIIDHEEPPEADFVIRDHRELPAILGGLS